MKAYDDIASTPLKWHGFYKYFMPLMASSALINLFWGLKNKGIPEGIVIIDYIYDIVLVACVVAAIYGFLYWKPIGWYGVMGLQAVQLLYIAIILAAAASAGAISRYMLVRIVYTSVFSVLVGLYYYKRKALFFNTLVIKLSQTPGNGK